LVVEIISRNQADKQYRLVRWRSLWRASNSS